MSVHALLPRQVIRSSRFSIRKPIQAFLLAAPFILLAPGATMAGGQDSEWRYWVDYEKRPYPSQFVPLKTVPPVPSRRHGVYTKDDHSYEDSAGYRSASKRKKIHKRVYSKPDYAEDHERYDSAEYDHEPYDDEYPAGEHEGYDGGRGFGRLFPDAKPEDDKRHPSFRALRALGRSMVEEGRKNDPAGNSEMPAGYTYFGQFIDHDITFETETNLGREIVGDYQLVNARTPDLDLDSVYGGGPRRTPHLYSLPYLRVGRLVSNDGGLDRYDLFRTKASRRDGPGGGGAVALVGDPRNDENIIISQLHSAFIAFHNRTADILVERDYGHERGEYCDGYERCSTHDLARALPDKVKEEIFETARDHVIYYYHRLILDDFLPRVIGPHHTANLLKYKRDFFFPEGFEHNGDEIADIYIPIEFSFVFRYGHSQVRDSYLLREGERFDLLSDGENGSPRAFQPVRPRHLVDWRYFFEIDGEVPEGFNYARRIDTELVKSLHRLNFSRAVGSKELGSLAARNLARSKALHIPTGQALAKLILPKLEERGLFGHDREGYDGDLWREFLLSPDERTEYFLGDAKTPLWYYIVQEAEVFGTATHLRGGPLDGAEIGPYSDREEYGPRLRRASFKRSHDEDYRHDRHDGGGHRLGPVGGAIVGEVLMGLMEHYAAKTSKGLDYDPAIKGGLSELATDGGASRKRYLMRNFLLDAGVVRRYE